MTHETTAPVQSLVDEILADLDQSTAGHCELNTSNYDHDDVCRLNDWGVDACMALEKAAELIREQQALIAQHAAPVAGQDALRAKAENFVARMRKGAEGDRAAERELEGEDADEAQACAVQAYIQEGAADMVEQLLAAAPTPPAGPWESPCTPPAQQPSVFWVLFDATGPEKFIKKMMPEGFLAFFDNESDARRAKAQNPGTDFKRVEYYKAPPAQQSHVIRAAYEVLLGCIKRPEIAALIDTAGVEKIAKQLNNLLPGHGDTAAPEQAEHPHQVNRSVIRDVFLRNGFAIKEGHSDLKPYVYAAAEELLALDGKAVAAEQDAAKVPRKLLRHVCDWLFFHEYPLLQGDKSEGYRLATELRALLGGDA